MDGDISIGTFGVFPFARNKTKVLKGSSDFQREVFQIQKHSLQIALYIEAIFEHEINVKYLLPKQGEIVGC